MHGLHRCEMVNGALRNMLIVDDQLAQQGLLQFLGGVEAGLLEAFTDAPVKPLDHAVGLWVARWA